MAQFARPISDVSNTGFTNNASGSTNLWQAIDESVADDTDFLQHSAGSTTYECLLGAVTDPVSSTGHDIVVRMKGSGTAFNTTVELFQGTTIITTRSGTVPAGTFTNYTFTLTAAQADAITDYSNLRIRLTGSNTVATQYVAQAYLTVPDAPAAGGALCMIV